MEATASFFGFGHKKKQPTSPTTAAASDPSRVSEKAPQLPELNSLPPITASPTPKSLTRSLSPASLSPRSAQPRLSTSSSQIFERNVQDSLPPAPGSPAIPAHIQTDDHIPPVLSASSLAITDNSVSVDEVQIVTTTTHQPAVSVVLTPNPASPTSVSPTTTIRTGSEETLDGVGAAEKRRLSFISFADVVQSEQTSAGSSPVRGSPVLKGRETIEEALRRRSPSPIRLSSAVSAELNPDLSVQTMRQALRRSASGDLGR